MGNREYKVREVKRYIVTEFERSEHKWDRISKPLGIEVENLSQANYLARSLAKANDGVAVTMPEEE